MRPPNDSPEGIWLFTNSLRPALCRPLAVESFTMGGSGDRIPVDCAGVFDRERTVRSVARHCEGDLVSCHRTSNGSLSPLSLQRAFQRTAVLLKGEGLGPRPTGGLGRHLPGSGNFGGFVGSYERASTKQQRATG